MTETPGNQKRDAGRQKADQVLGLVERARSLFHTDRAETRRLATQALELARAEDNHCAAALALNLMADAARMEGDIELGLEHARQGLEQAEAAGDERVRADAVNNLGLLVWHKGQFDLAIQYFNEALRVREGLKDERDVAAVCNNLSLMYWEKGDLARALDYQQRSLGIRERTGDRYGMGVSYLNLGLVYVDLGDWDKALECYFRALAERERAKDKADIALCYNNIGEVYLRRGKLDRAWFYFRQTLELGRAAPSTWIQAEVLGNMGEAAFVAGDFVQAREFYEQDRGICLKTDDREELTETTRRIAELDLAEGSLGEASQRLDQALELALATGSRREQGNLHRVLGKLAWKAKDLGRARSEFEKSIEILRSVGKSFELGCTLLELGRLELETGADAGPAVSEAKAIFEGLGVSGKVVRAERLLQRTAGAAERLDTLPKLTRLACKSLDPEQFCSAALGLIREELGVAGASVFLRDGRVFGSGKPVDLGQGPGRTNLALEVGSNRLGTLMLCGEIELARVGPMAEILALGIFQVQSRPGAPAAGPAAAGRFPGIVGADTTLRDVFGTLEKVGPTRASVLILGDSGTGKELVARTLHQVSDRRDGPFVAVNCAAIPETLLESELFGVEKGTATGVVERKGRFEVAHGGTLFLDEIGDMSIALQAKILRVLQERAFERVGGRKPVSVDVRIVAATNRDLEKEIASGRFRRDLFYRLNVVTISLPPLRERKQDIPALVSFFADRAGREYSKPVKGVTDDCLASLVSYDWPGNVRELENVIERGVIMSRGQLVTVDDLPSAMQRPAAPEPEWKSIKRGARAINGSSQEQEAVIQALTQTNWVVKKASEKLGISRMHLYRMIRKYRLKRPAPEGRKP